MREQSKWLLFDLGGVLMNFIGVPELAKLAGKSLEDTRNTLFFSDAVELHQVGKISDEQFAANYVAEVSLDISPEDFLALWESWETGPLEGAMELLDELAGENNLACLSNTNNAHWVRLMARYGLRERLQRHYASHQIGFAKPDPRIFAYVANDLGTAPENITYFDDAQHIVDAAITFGFDAYQVNGPADIRQILGT